MQIRLKKLLFLLFLLTISSIGATEVKVENFIFERTEYSGKYLDSTYIILSTDKTTNVKCAVFDKNDKPLRVSEDIVTPPLSEVIVLSSDAIVTSVQCWELESSEYEQMLEKILLEFTENIDSAETSSYSINDEERRRLDELEAERTRLQMEFEQEQYNRLLSEEIQADKDKAYVIDDQLYALQSAYVSNVAARVKSNWRYQGAEDDWTCEVYIVQDRDGTVVAADIRNCNVDDSAKAKTFKDSVRRAVYKASPLPSAPDETVFDRELIFIFSVN